MIHWSVLVALRIIEGVGGVSNALIYIVQFVCSIIPFHINKFLHSFNVCLYFGLEQTKLFGISPSIKYPLDSFDFKYAFCSFYISAMETSQ
jgi:hypothetical protein